MKEIICLFILAIIGGIGVYSAAYFVERQSCLSAYENLQPQFGPFSGCRIMVDGVLTPVDIVRELK